MRKERIRKKKKTGRLLGKVDAGGIEGFISTILLLIQQFRK